VSDTVRSAPRPGCPDLELLAAFVERRLAVPERDLVVEHLADCDGCREVVAESAALLATMAGEAGGERVRPHPSRRAVRRWALAGVAAALVAAAIGLFVLLRPSPDRLLARLVASGATSELAADWGDPRWPVMRGDEPGTDDLAHAFRLGVRSVDLELALATGDLVLAERFAREAEASLAALPFADVVARRLGELATRIGGGGSAGSLAEEARRALDEARGYVDPSLYDLGRWAETGRLAASLGRPVRQGSPPELAGGARRLADAVAGAAAASSAADPTATARAFDRLIAEAGRLR
jgi:hypothetical protein